MPKRDKIILKWAGGKSLLIKKIIDSLAKENFNNYLEPFLMAVHSSISFKKDL